MQYNRKKLPLLLLTALRYIEEKCDETIAIEMIDNNSILLSEKNDPGSDFFFKVDLMPDDGNDDYPFNVAFAPWSQRDVSGPEAMITSLGGIEKFLDEWLGYLKMYDDLKSPIFDDPIAKNYYDTIEEDFKIVDENAETAPFSYEQQGMLLAIYERTKGLVNSKKTNDNSDYAQIILEEIHKAEITVQKETKNQAIERLRKIAAMCMKYSYEVGKAMVAEILVEVGKRLLMGGL